MPLPKRRGRPPLPDAEPVADIGVLVAELPTYGYCRVHALLRRQAQATNDNTASDVWADTVYCSLSSEAWLRSVGRVSRVHAKKP